MTLKVQLVSPERVMWSGDAEMVTTRTVEGGDITFLDGHTSFIGALEIGRVTIRPAEGADVEFAVHGGFVEVSDNFVSVLSDISEAAAEIDVARATRARDAARAAVGQDASDADAGDALRRAELRLAVAGVSPDAH